MCYVWQCILATNPNCRRMLNMLYLLKPSPQTCSGIQKICQKFKRFRSSIHNRISELQWYNSQLFHWNPGFFSSWLFWCRSHFLKTRLKHSKAIKKISLMLNTCRLEAAVVEGIKQSTDKPTPTREMRMMCRASVKTITWYEPIVWNLEKCTGVKLNVQGHVSKVTVLPSFGVLKFV